MLLLSSTSDLLRVITSAALNLDAHVSFADLAGASPAFDRKNTPISTATTTTICNAPGSGVVRSVKTMCLRNRDATTSNDVTVVLTDGTNAMELIKVTLLAGEALHYHEGAGFYVTNALGRTKTDASNNGNQVAVNALNLVVLSADVTNNNATANTIADVTGLSFSVVSGFTYFFRFLISFTAAATTTGSRWSVNGPASPTLLSYRSNYALTTTTETVNNGLSAYDTPAAANATSAATGANVAVIEGIITPSANGTVIARFASEVSSSAIVAKAGSVLEWVRTL